MPFRFLVGIHPLLDLIQHNNGHNAKRATVKPFVIPIGLLSISFPRGYSITFPPTPIAFTTQRNVSFVDSRTTEQNHSIAQVARRLLYCASKSTVGGASANECSCHRLREFNARCRTTYRRRQQLRRYGGDAPQKYKNETQRPSSAQSSRTVNLVTSSHIPGGSGGRGKGLSADASGYISSWTLKSLSGVNCDNKYNFVTHFLCKRRSSLSSDR